MHPNLLSAISLSFFIALSSCASKTEEVQRKISLNGEWEITETSNPDSLPSEYSSKIIVPSFIDRATPQFKKLSYKLDTARYFWYHRTFSINHNDADVVELEIKKVKYGAQIYINGVYAGVKNIAFSSSRINIKNLLNTESNLNEITICVGTT